MRARKGKARKHKPASGNIVTIARAPRGGHRVGDLSDDVTADISTQEGRDLVLYTAIGAVHGAGVDPAEHRRVNQCDEIDRWWREARDRFGAWQHVGDPLFGWTEGQDDR